MSHDYQFPADEVVVARMARTLRTVGTPYLAEPLARFICYAADTDISEADRDEYDWRALQAELNRRRAYGENVSDYCALDSDGKIFYLLAAKVP